MNILSLLTEAINHDENSTQVPNKPFDPNQCGRPCAQGRWTMNPNDTPVNLRWSWTQMTSLAPRHAPAPPAPL
jgi:hypothetical protein